MLQPTIDEMARRGTPFSGLLYVGLALTSGGVARSSSMHGSAIPRPSPCGPPSNAPRRTPLRRRYRGSCSHPQLDLERVQRWPSSSLGLGLRVRV